MYDLIIIGGGPAGLTAAVYAIRKRLELPVDQPGSGRQGHGAHAHRGRGYLSGRSTAPTWSAASATRSSILTLPASWRRSSG